MTACAKRLASVARGRIVNDFGLLNCSIMLAYGEMDATSPNHGTENLHRDIAASEELAGRSFEFDCHDEYYRLSQAFDD
jgi:hypothetical protein